MNEDIAGFDQCVRESAYYLWEDEGRPAGRHVEHWLICEQALRAERSVVTRVAADSVVAPAPEAPAAPPRKAAAKPKSEAKPKAEAKPKLEAKPRKKAAAPAVRRRAPMAEMPATLQ